MTPLAAKPWFVTLALAGLLVCVPAYEAVRVSELEVASFVGTKYGSVMLPPKRLHPPEETHWAWLRFAGAALVPAAWLGVAACGAISKVYVAHRGRRRRLTGRCVHCGYDLRESKNGCPECGAEQCAHCGYDLDESQNSCPECGSTKGEAAGCACRA
jgi:RNA polymerase subunit RPABC4/transcription elongation factor Spt4